MKDAPIQPRPRKRGGIPKGETCAGCGGTSTGVHLDHALLPGPACGAVHITYLDTAKITHYACGEKVAHEPPHRDGEKEWI